MTRHIVLPGGLAPWALAAIIGTGIGISAANAVPGGDLAVMPNGNYVCELPGDTGDPGIAGGRHEPAADFEIVGDSSYRAQGLRGTYLLTGEHLVMTSGPFSGRRFRRVERSFLRELGPGGADAPLRCISSIQAIGIEPSERRRCKALQPQDTMALAGPRSKSRLAAGSKPVGC